MSTLPENNSNVNIKLFMLDPLSIIIKLAIIGNKPVGTKILIHNNNIFLQEPGPFQAFCRYMFNTNKTDLQFMYNPIQIACQTFLTKEDIQETPRLKTLFICAQLGIEKLKETYKTCSMICLCLNYYHTIITNSVEQIYNDTIFRKDSMTLLYTNEIIKLLNSQWTHEKIKVILDLIAFLTNDKMAINNVKSLENIMDNIDIETQQILSNI
jgi:hypothetical protein